MKAVFLEGSCVLVNDAEAIDRLQKSGIGARQLHSILGSESPAVANHTVSPLLLLDEEVFYLAQKGAMEVELSPSNEIATLQYLWNIFVERNPSFPVKYKVFAYYKDKSYVVRIGVNFGVDYCAYHTLPSLCHSEMCITVVDAIRPASLQSVSSCVAQAEVETKQDQLGWRHVTTLTRVIPDVNKLCVICYVLPSTENEALACTKEASQTVKHTPSIHTKSETHEALRAAEQASAMEMEAAPVATVTVSPYLASLFPHYHHHDHLTHTAPKTTILTTADTSRATGSVDLSTFTCLDQLVVRSVTALVRRMPAICETYQTIKMIQEEYHKSSTAKKKRDFKANASIKDRKKKKQKQKQSNGENVAAAATSVPFIAHSQEKNADDMIRDSSAADETSSAPVSGAETAELSGRQKRVLKAQMKRAVHLIHLQQAHTTAPQEQEQEEQEQKQGHEAQPQSSATALSAQSLVLTTQSNSCSGSGSGSGSGGTMLLPQSKQVKERRDHREVRTKTLSGKNKSLLDMMEQPQVQAHVQIPTQPPQSQSHAVLALAQALPEEPAVIWPESEGSGGSLKRKHLESSPVALPGFAACTPSTEEEATTPPMEVPTAAVSKDDGQPPLNPFEGSLLSDGTSSQPGRGVLPETEAPDVIHEDRAKRARLTGDTETTGFLSRVTSNCTIC